jgi:hypothetical protein
MSTEDLYGFNAGDLETARTLVEKALGVEFDLRNSSYHGGDYYSKQLDNKDEILVQTNNDNDGQEGSWADEDYKNFGILLRVYSPEHGDEYKSILTSNGSGFIILERSLTTPTRVLRNIRYAGGKEEVYFEKQLDPA